MAILATAGKVMKKGISAINKTAKGIGKVARSSTDEEKGTSQVTVKTVIFAIILLIYMMLAGGGHYMYSNPDSVTKYSSSQYTSE